MTLPPFDFVAFILPPATALVGMRLTRWLLGESFDAQFGFGFRFAFGLGVGMLVFTQLLLLIALGGVNGAPALARLDFVWGAVEAVLLARKIPTAAKSIRLKPGHLWLIFLIPLLYSWWVFGQLSTLEGTLEYDANVFWVFKSKIFFLDQGRELIHFLRQSNLGYMHMDYPMLVPCLYTLGYGAVGMVDEFVNKVWPFWMMVALCAAVVSLARIWSNPRLLPIAVITLIGFLPATIVFIRNEGATIPMVFCVSLATLLVARAISDKSNILPPAIVLALAICFSTKLEGAVFAGICGCALLPLCVGRKWLKDRIVWRTAAVAAICLVPYGLYRLTKPTPDDQSHWMGYFLTSPSSVLHVFPMVLFLNVFARFFGPQFFHWKADGNHIRWDGHWTGWSSLVNQDLSVLPWLLAGLLIFTAICKPKARKTLAVLSAVIAGIFLFLSFVIAALPHWTDSQFVDMTCNVTGRQFYPFLVAYFLGIAGIWFRDDTVQPHAAAQVVQPRIEPLKQAREVLPQKSKRRR